MSRKITTIAHWDRGWLDPAVEAFIFRQPCEAYGVDRILFVGPKKGDVAKVEQFETIEEALNTCQGQLVFLEPSAEKTLDEIPDGDIVLILGSAVMDNLAYSKPEDRYRFNMLDPANKGIFSVTAIGIALHEIYEHGSNN